MHEDFIMRSRGVAIFSRPLLSFDFLNYLSR